MTTTSTETQSSPAVPAIDLSDEGGIGAWEWVVIGAMTVAAIVYLARKLGIGVPRSGCSTCGSAAKCAPNSPRPRP